MDSSSFATNSNSQVAKSDIFDSELTSFCRSHSQGSKSTTTRRARRLTTAPRTAGCLPSCAPSPTPTAEIDLTRRCVFCFFIRSLLSRCMPATRTWWELDSVLSPNSDRSRLKLSILRMPFEVLEKIFTASGGGTDDGKTFAHVTVAHMLNDNLKKVIYEGNASSYSLVCLNDCPVFVVFDSIQVNFDIFTHCGKSSDASHVVVCRPAGSKACLIRRWVWRASPSGAISVRPVVPLWAASRPSIPRTQCTNACDLI